MPAFEEPNCAWKMILFMFLSIVVSINIIYIAGTLWGLLGATIAMLLFIIFTWWFVDTCRSSIFSCKSYTLNEEDTKKYKDIKFQLQIRDKRDK